MSDNIFRLAKPVKKGIGHLIFSRFFIIVLLILLQLFLVFGFYYWLGQIAHWITIFYIVIDILAIIYLFNCRIDATAKLTWMFLIAVLPVAGSLFFWFTQKGVVNNQLKKKILHLIKETKEAIDQPEEVLEELKSDPSGTAALHEYLKKSGCFPLYSNTEVTYFPSGEAKFETLLKELRKAEKFIYLEYFIIEEGYMWGEILRILLEKAKQGVDVRVMYDGMCEISQLPADYWKLLEKQGIRAKSFFPIMPIISTHYNYRDHRKILVIDGKVAFNGGVNLADEYINRKERFGYWKDTAVMLKGEAVKSFSLMFLQMWNYDQKKAPVEAIRTDPALQVDGVGVPAAGYVMPFGECPLNEYKAGEAVYMDILNRAQKYVYIMTPYLILDGELETSLKYAAQRGVDVRIILPGIPDKKMAFALAKSHYSALVEAGVKIYEFTPGFVHAKVFVCDDSRAVVGTINLDYRSLYHHFECATYMYGVSCVPQIKQDYMQTLAECKPVTSKDIKNEKKSYKLVGTLMKFLAPLM